MVETRGLSQHQLIRQIAQINRCLGQTIGDCRPGNSRQGQGGGAILMIRPHHRITHHLQPMRQRVTPAKPQPAIHFHRTGAVQPGPLERQNPVQRTINQGEQFLPGHHRHRAAISGGVIRTRSGIPVLVFPRNGHIIHMLFVLQHGVLPRLPAHLHGALLQPTHHPAKRHRLVAIHRLHKLRQDLQQPLNKTHCRPKNLLAIPDQP